MFILQLIFLQKILQFFLKFEITSWKCLCTILGASQLHFFIKFEIISILSGVSKGSVYQLVAYHRHQSTGIGQNGVDGQNARLSVVLALPNDTENVTTQSRFL